MPTPETPGRDPDETRPTPAADRAGANLPVNIAPPNWQCPHCRTAYRLDLDTATECAQAGPPPPVTAGTPVLVLDGVGHTENASGVVFGLTELGPVKPVTVEGKRQHRNDVVVAGTQVNSAVLAATEPNPNGLVVLAGDRTRDLSATVYAPSLSSFGALASLFLDEATRRGYGYRSSGPEVTVWLDEVSRHTSEDFAWWRAPDEEERATLNVVTNGLLDKVAETDETALVAEVRAGYAHGRPRHHSAQRPADLATPAGGLMIAAAHGAPNHIWALRWLTAHLDEVATWQARALRAWAAGDTDGPGPLPAGFTLRVADSLPNNPGKRRLAVMEPYGDTYSGARNAVLAKLLTDAPVHPIAGLADVVTTVSTTHEGN